MALTHLVDTSVLKRLADSEIRAQIEHRVGAGAISRPSICDLEIGYSARNGTEWDRLIQALDAFEPIETTSAHIRRALRLLAQRSQRGSKIPDLLVAAAAEEHDLTLLHYDADIDLIASVTGQRCRWIVPAGGAD